VIREYFLQDCDAATTQAAVDRLTRQSLAPLARRVLAQEIRFSTTPLTEAADRSSRRDRCPRAMPAATTAVKTRSIVKGGLRVTCESESNIELGRWVRVGVARVEVDGGSHASVRRGAAAVLEVGRQLPQAGALPQCQDPTVRAGAVPRRPSVQLAARRRPPPRIASLRWALELSGSRTFRREFEVHIARTLGDVHLRGDVSHADAWIVGDAEQHQSVVGEERERPQGVKPRRTGRWNDMISRKNFSRHPINAPYFV